MLGISAVNAYGLHSKIQGRIDTKLYYTMEILPANFYKANTTEPSTSAENVTVDKERNQMLKEGLDVTYVIKRENKCFFAKDTITIYAQFVINK